MRAGTGRQWWVLIACVAVVGVVAALGGFLPRHDAPDPQLALGTTVDTRLGEVTVDAVHGAASGVTVRLTVTSAMQVPLDVNELIHVVDDEGGLSTVPAESAIDDDVWSYLAQPGVTDTFTLVYEYERRTVGDVRIEVWDAEFLPRDDTSFGIFDNFYDGRVAGVVTVSS